VQIRRSGRAKRNGRDGPDDRDQYRDERETRENVSARPPGYGRPRGYRTVGGRRGATENVFFQVRPAKTTLSVRGDGDGGRAPYQWVSHRSPADANNWLETQTTTKNATAERLPPAARYDE